MQPSSTLQRGLAVEDRAVAFLLSRVPRPRLLARNVRYRFGEIDLILQDGPILVFVEVRLRTAGGWVDGVSSVTAPKRRRLANAIRAFLGSYRGPASEIRVDLLAWDGVAWDYRPGIRLLDS